MTKRSKKALIAEAEKSIVILTPFMSAIQRKTVRGLFKGEEGEYFCETMNMLAQRVATMPKSYEQDGKGDQAIVYLHYFAGGAANWWITEKDAEIAKEPGQTQAFGLANLFGGPNDRDAELGYISIEDLVAHNAELDFHFEPRTLAALKNPQAAEVITPAFKAPTFDAQAATAALRAL